MHAYVHTYIHMYLQSPSPDPLMSLKMPSLIEAIYDSLNMYSNVPNQSQLNQIQLILTTYNCGIHMVKKPGLAI